MSEFSRELIKIRKDRGHKSAKEFFGFLQDHGLSCNYSHYMKIEKGDLSPSPELVAEMGRALSEDEKEGLVLIFCRSLFPESSHLFPLKKTPRNSTTQEHSIKENRLQLKPSPGQSLLTVRQVFIIAQTEAHYDVFLFLTLARRPLSLSEIQEQGISKEKINQILKDFSNEKLIRYSDEGVSMIHTDLAFPPPSTDSQIPPLYRRLDEWDQKIADRYKFELVQKRMFLRRISERHLSLIAKNLEFTFDLIKSSDETDKKYNDSVIHFQVHLKAGKMPG